MNIIVWLVLGGLVGLVASRLTGSPLGIVVDVAVGIGGSFIGAWLLGPFVGNGPLDAGQLSAPGLGAALLGAVVLIALLHLARRGSAR